MEELIAELAEVFSKTANDVGKRFTCSESDTIARFLAAAGHPEKAAHWLDSHARGDESEDWHYNEEARRPMNEPEISAYIITHIGA